MPGESAGGGTVGAVTTTAGGVGLVGAGAASGVVAAAVPDGAAVAWAANGVISAGLHAERVSVTAIILQKCFIYPL